MKVFILVGIMILLSLIITPRTTYGQEAKSVNNSKEICDFSEYDRLKEPHTLYKAAVKKTQPEYPTAARSVRAEGQVVVRIIVSKKGDVVEACAVTGHPLLWAASVKAAKKWKFKKNFGFHHYSLTQRFAEIDLTFNFALP